MLMPSFTEEGEPPRELGGRVTGRIERGEEEEGKEREREREREREKESLQPTSSPLFFFLSPALCNPFLVIHSAASCSFAV